MLGGSMEPFATLGNGLVWFESLRSRSQTLGLRRWKSLSASSLGFEAMMDEVE